MTASAIVRIRKMRFWGRHGVTPEERDSPQEIELDVELVVAAAAPSDRIEDAVDYDVVYRRCERIVTQRSFSLLESLGHACLDDMMNDPRVLQASVRLRKPRLLDGATPEVELVRVRGQDR